ncbi:MAG: pyridoxal phosphate-dependent aminotransferase [Desulfobulbus sp.]|jgi:threonine-phosphate decarboxylase
MIHGHGGDVVAVAAALGCRADEIVDMSSNINPLGPMPGLIEHLRAQMDCIRSLPEPDACGAVRAIARLLDVGEERLLAGAGTTQFIACACAALASRRVLIAAPTYADYADGCRMHGLEPELFLSGPEAGFAVELDRLASVLAGCDTVFFCNPNNPTGQLTARADLVALCAAHPETRFVIDESYLPFVPDWQEHSMLFCGLANVAVLWSVSKIFGMPGLRVGFLVAEPALLSRFARFMQPWSVNSLGQEAVRFLGDHAAEAARFIAATCAFVEEERRLLLKRLAPARLTLFPGRTSYTLMRLEGDRDAATIRRILAKERFLVRDCANFQGLDSRYLRLALKDPEANEAAARLLVEAVGLRDGQAGAL